MQRAIDPSLELSGQSVDFAFDQTPKRLAAALVRLAVNGADGDLWPSLRNLSGPAVEILSEVLVLYLHSSDRITSEFFSLVGADAASRDSFFTEVAREACDLLSAGVAQVEDRVSFARSFIGTLDARRSEYDQCQQMVRSSRQGLEGTAVFAFYKHLLAYGSEAAVLTMSQIQLEEVEKEVLDAFTQIADRINYIPGLLAAQSSLAAN
jgi:hypothetical protein